MRAEGCGRCGAALETDGSCSWCGAPAASRSAPARAPAPRAAQTTAERIAAFRASPAYTRLAVREIQVAPPAGAAARVAFGVLLTAVSLGSIVFQRAAFSDPFFDSMRWPMTGVPLVFAAVGAGIALSAAHTLRGRRAFPVQPVAAAVIARRFETASQGAQLVTDHYVGLEFADGSRDEFEAESPAVATVRDGEIGVAYMRSGVVVAFRVAGAAPPG